MGDVEDITNNEELEQPGGILEEIERLEAFIDQMQPG
jgi:hypothetical protein